MLRTRREMAPALMGVVLLAVFGATASAAQSVSAAAPADTVTIEMVDFAFQPAAVTVRVGDVVRFVQASNSPHNVEFTDVPDGARLGDEYVLPVEEIGTRAAAYPPERMGPYLVQKGETYAFTITDAFVAGEYRYICTPHVTMGMKGKLVVEAP